MQINKVALFDLDKTIYNGYSLIDFMFEYIVPNNLTSKKNIEKAEKLVYEFTNQLISYNEAATQAVHLAAEILKDRTVTEVAEWQPAFFKKEKLFPFCSELFELLKKHGFEIYLLSATVEPVVSHIARTLSVNSFSSSLKIADGVYTGEVETLLNQKEKAKIVKQLRIDSRNLFSLGYGDSSGDVDFLSTVVHAFLLEPTESEVIKLAEKKEWHIVSRDDIFQVTKSIVEL